MVCKQTWRRSGMSDVLEQIKTVDKPVLISFGICPFVQRSAILMNVKGQAFERINIDLANKPDWFLELVPTGKVPALVINELCLDTNEGNDIRQEVLFESAIINEFLDEQYGDPLLPANALEKARQRSWVAFAENLIFLQYQLMKAETEAAYVDLKNQLLNELIKLKPVAGKPYFDGKQFSLVDAAFAPLFTRMQWLPEITSDLADIAAKDYKGEVDKGSNSTEHSDDVLRLIKWMEHLRTLPDVVNSVDDDFSKAFEIYFKQFNSFVISKTLNAA